MRIEYGGYTGNRILIGTTDSFKATNMLINKFIRQNKIRSYYQIMNFEPETWRLDYGSHVDFIWISDLPNNAEELYKESIRKC